MDIVTNREVPLTWAVLFGEPLPELHQLVVSVLLRNTSPEQVPITSQDQVVHALLGASWGENP